MQTKAVLLDAMALFFPVTVVVEMAAVEEKAAVIGHHRAIKIAMTETEDPCRHRRLGRPLHRLSILAIVAPTLPPCG